MFQNVRDWLIDLAVNVYSHIERGSPYLAVKGLDSEGRQLRWEDQPQMIILDGDRVFFRQTAIIADEIDTRAVCIVWRDGDNLDPDLIRLGIDLEMPEVTLEYPKIFTNYQSALLKNTLASIFTPDLQPVNLSPSEISRLFYPDLAFIEGVDKITIYNREEMKHITFHN